MDWIPLTERKPTAEDADGLGWLPFAMSDETIYSFRWDKLDHPIMEGATHFLPIPKPPTETEPVAGESA